MLSMAVCNKDNRIHQKGMHLNQDFHVVVGKNFVQKMRMQITNTISLYKLTNVLLFYYSFVS